MISQNMILEIERENIFLSIWRLHSKIFTPSIKSSSNTDNASHTRPEPTALRNCRHGTAPLDKSPFINAVHGFNGVPGLHEIHSLPLLPFPWFHSFGISRIPGREMRGHISIAYGHQGGKCAGIQAWPLLRLACTRPVRTEHGNSNYWGIMIDTYIMIWFLIS
jgi:hypothetical protein